MNKVLQILSIALITSAWATGANAQEVTLVSIGKFQSGATYVIGGIENYIVDCNESTGLCTDNLTNVWTFGENLPDTRIRLCELSINVISFDCVHTMQVNLLLNGNYKDAVVEVVRYFCGRQDVFFDDKYLGSVRGDTAGTGIAMNVQYAIGVIKKGKRVHTLVLTAPDNDISVCGPEGHQVISMPGFAIKGVPGR
jgi:hypothetical protein